MFQYFENAIEPKNRDLKHKVLFPSKSTFKGRRYDNWDKNDRERTIRNCESRLLLTHNDADGLVCGALFLDYFNEVDVVNLKYENIVSTLEYISENGEEIEELYVSDLNLDEADNVIADVSDTVDSFIWIDHHEWEDTAQEVSDMGVEMHINQDRCAAGLVHDYILNRGYETDDKTLETVQLTEDHDLWNHEMDSVMLGAYEVCISKVFNQMAFYSDTNKFMNEILEHGADFIDYEQKLLRDDDMGEGFLAQVEAEHQMKVKYITENETIVKEIGDYRVAFAHGRASPGEILETLVDQEDIDILVHTKPQYPVKASIRSTDEFDRCHKIAQKLGGGGHAQAAGCKPEIAQSPLEFNEYIHNKGKSLQNRIEEVVREDLEKK